MREVVYRDDEGIKNLFAQIEDLQTTGVTIETEGKRELGFVTKAKVELGSFLSKLGLPTAELSGDASVSHERKLTRKAEFAEAPEATYRSIMRHLSGKNILYKDIYDAWCAARVSAGGAFCEIDGEFVPAGWETNNDAWLKFANEQGSLILHGAQDKSLLVGMGTPKIFGTRDGIITPVCHLAIRLRRGKTSFRIFGRMDKSKYIKPFLVTYG